jgi:hypothetical protein
MSDQILLAASRSCVCGGPEARGILALDFFTADLLNGTKVYVLPVIEHGTRRIRVLGAMENPAQSWVVHRARNLKHRPHRTLNQVAPLRPLPDGVTDLDHFRVRGATAPEASFTNITLWHRDAEGTGE